MKFLCDHCKAKYQIPDEKIAGRTLRMKCRKCGHDIVIRGPKQADASASRPAASPRRAGSSPSARRRTAGSHAGPRPSPRKGALGAEFRRSAPATAQAPSRPTAEWYVAINDVPVGPIKREEVARKIATGAVDEESLCWREGFDDWIPLRQVPELMALLKQRRGAPPLRSSRPAAPAPASRSNVVPIGGRLGAAAAPALDDFGFDDADEKTVMAPMPAGLGDAGGGLAAAEARAPAPAARVPAPARVPPPAAAVASVPSASSPSASSPAAAPTSTSSSGATPAVAPAAPSASSTGPAAAVAPSAPSASGSGAAPAGEAPASPLPGPMVSGAQPSAPPPDAGADRRRLPVGAWIAMVGAGCFGIAFAVVLGNKMLAEPPAPVASNETPAPAQEPPPQVEAQVELDVPEATEEAQAEEPEASDEGGAAAEAEEPAVATGTRPAPRTTMRPATTSMAASSTSMNDAQLSEAQRRLLAQLTMDDGTSGTPGMIVARDTTSSGSMRQALDGDAVSRVVRARSNQAALQRCYNRAIRGLSEPPDVRLDVVVRVGASGSVTSVQANGNDFGGLKSCVQQTVRRWRFPPSSGGGETRFPLVFSAPG